MQGPVFHRHELAIQIADELLGAGFGQLVANPGSGTFLSAKRRTGKSTFLKTDLIPELAGREIPVIYVDLWSDPSIDPALLINQVIKNELHAQEGFVARTARALGMSKVTVAGAFTFDITAVGSGVTIAQALTELVEKHPAGRVALIIDEAQHALTTDAGQAAMFALKAARDAMNIGQDLPRLLLLCTGSSRSKLGGLVTGKESPFFGARVREFPALDRSFADYLIERMRSRLRDDIAVSADAVFRAFELLGRRPEEMINVIADAIYKYDGVNLDALILQLALERRDANLAELDRQFNSLPILQQAILLRLVQMDTAFAPYDADAQEAYRGHVGEAIQVTVPNIQTALDALVASEIVWKPKRGGYVIDDPLWNDWAENRTGS